MTVLYPTIFRRYDVAWQSWSFGCRGMSRRQHLYRRGDCMAGRTRSVTVWPYAGGGGCSGASDVDFGAVESEKVKKHRFFFADKKLSSTFASSLRQEHIIGLWCNGNTTDSGPVIPSSNLGSPTPRPPPIAEVFCCLVPIRRCRVGYLLLWCSVCELRRDVSPVFSGVQYGS